MALNFFYRLKFIYIIIVYNYSERPSTDAIGIFTNNMFSEKLIILQKGTLRTWFLSLVKRSSKTTPRPQSLYQRNSHHLQASLRELLSPTILPVADFPGFLHTKSPRDLLNPTEAVGSVPRWRLIKKPQKSDDFAFYLISSLFLSS